MVAIVPGNPMATTNSQGTFNVSSDGDVQGTFYDDPAVRYALMGGIVALSETIPMWGGVGIYEDIPQPTTASPSAELGPVVGRATGIASGLVLSGFCVFNQAHNMITSPQSAVPLSGSNMTINYMRLGSGARLAVKCAPALVSLEGGLVGQQVSWDFNGQMLVPYVASYAVNVITNATWASTSGGQVTFTTTTSHGVAVGDYFSISGMTPAGYNGDFLAITGTTGSTLVAALTTNPGTSPASVMGQLDAGGGALPCRINRISPGNSMTVDYDPDTGFASWNYQGTTAIIQI